MKQVMYFIISILYCSVVYYLLFLFWSFVIPHAMFVNNWWMLLLILVLSGLYYSIVESFICLATIPFCKLIEKCEKVKYIPVFYSFLFGGLSIFIVWGLDIDYLFLQWLIGIYLTFYIIKVHYLMGVFLMLGGGD